MPGLEVHGSVRQCFEVHRSVSSWKRKEVHGSAGKYAAVHRSHCDKLRCSLYQAWLRLSKGPHVRGPERRESRPGWLSDVGGRLLATMRKGEKEDAGKIW